jgi:glycosyltransferase involved in cell wall biosynthesis
VQPIVGIDASRYPGKIRTGTETYSRELLDAIARLGDLPFALRSYVNRADTESVEHLGRLGEVRHLPFPRLWTHGRLSGEMLRHRPDLLFVPSHVIPLVHPRSVVTIHDLGYLHEPEAHPAGQRRILDLTTRWNARAAAQIIAISETTKSDLTRIYGTPADKITVIYHGISEVFSPAAESEIDRVRSAFALPDRFVLAVGTIQPRKNLARLAQAVAALRVEFPDLALVVAGKRGWMADSVLADVRAALPHQHFRELGYVPLADIPALYSTTSVTALVSTYEGFGLPVIEAMASGSPVVISDAPALTEIAGGAALIAEARSVSGIADALKTVLIDSGTAARIAASGRAHSTTFTWNKAARETVNLLDRVLENRAPR